MRIWRLVALATLLNAPAALAQTDTLLTAVRFALTGRDNANVVFKDRGNCIVEYRPDNSKGQWVWTYYLNAIDPSRSTLQLRPPTIFSPSGSIVVSVRGQTDLYDAISQFVPAERPGGLTIPAIHWHGSSAELGLDTTEVERVKRAWVYIYANGCKGSRSAF